MDVGAGGRRGTPFVSTGGALHNAVGYIQRAFIGSFNQYVHVIGGDFFFFFTIMYVTKRRRNILLKYCVAKDNATKQHILK